MDRTLQTFRSTNVDTSNQYKTDGMKLNSNVLTTLVLQVGQTPPAQPAVCSVRTELAGRYSVKVDIHSDSLWQRWED